ncbi:extracellular solute-binding protein [Paenirhodobacter populi]|uniref:extracellular solute-binding protein n=1 Tax=Paenirhodobacter populi TaxID=2306993 RepID=UPI000FE3B7FC|nr:extracellular solute-binding protein [Sinirhodobacter populi]RWR10229.1 extracellular solute-binding protein [Sinirhodobacter populi]
MTKLILNRRRFLHASAAATLATPYFYTAASAQDRVLQVGVYNSAQGGLIKKEVLPAFEKEFGCKVLTTEGATLANIASLRATRDNPVYSVMSMDDVGFPQAKAEGLIEELPMDEIPNLANVYPRYLFEENYGVGFAVSIAGLFINPQMSKPIESYAEIFEPKYARKMMLNTPKNTQSVLMLIVASALATGKSLQEAQYMTDEGWARLADLKPNVLTIYDGEAQVMMVAQGQATVGGIEYSKAIYPHTRKGVPLDMTYPKEGAFTGINGIALVKGAPQRELGLAWIDRLLSPEVQKMLAEATLSAPTVKGVEFSDDSLKYLAYPEARMEELNLFTPDWNYIIPRRAEWLEKYNQTFAG